MRLWLRSRYVSVLFAFMCFTKFDALGCGISGRAIARRYCEWPGCCFGASTTSARLYRSSRIGKGPMGAITRKVGTYEKSKEKEKQGGVTHSSY